MLLEPTQEMIGQYPLARMTIKLAESATVFKKLGFQDPDFARITLQGGKYFALGVSREQISRAFDMVLSTLPRDYYMEVVIQ